MKVEIVALGLMAAALAGCASYTPRSLPEHVDSLSSVSSVTLDRERLRFQNLSTHLFNPADGLDMDEVAMLAVANNPQLKLARDDLNVARAQSFAAGLLPDPQLGLSTDHPTNGTVGNTNAFSANLNQDISAFLLRSSRNNSAKADERRVNLELLWQEWQVVSEARLLYTRLRSQSDLMRLLKATQQLLADHYQHSRQALAAGNLTIDAVGANLAALQDVDRQLNELERNELQNRISLNALLGMAADTRLLLTGEPKAASFDASGLRADLEWRLRNRPDLRALQEGYQSQEERLRGAILAQFPALSVGLTRARDTSGLYTLGFGLNLTLPILNGNRGNVAIEKATRNKLFDEYQGRFNSAYNEVITALDNLPLLQDQLQRTRQGIKELDTVAQRAHAAYQAGNLAAPDYVRLESSLINKRTEGVNLQEALMEQQIALETLLGPDLHTQDNQNGSFR